MRRAARDTNLSPLVQVERIPSFGRHPVPTGQPVPLSKRAAWSLLLCPLVVEPVHPRLARVRRNPAPRAEVRRCGRKKPSLSTLKLATRGGTRSVCPCRTTRVFAPERGSLHTKLQSGKPRGRDSGRRTSALRGAVPGAWNELRAAAALLAGCSRDRS